MKPCPQCRRHIAVSEAHCLFCGTPQRMTQAWPAWLLTLSLTGLGACVADDPMTGSPSTMSGSASNSGGTSVGVDTVDDDWGEGVTYAGPAWDTSDGFEPGDESTTGDMPQGSDSSSGDSSGSGSGSDSGSSGDSSGSPDPDTGATGTESGDAP